MRAATPARSTFLQPPSRDGTHTQPPPKPSRSVSPARSVMSRAGPRTGILDRSRTEPINHHARPSTSSAAAAPRVTYRVAVDNIGMVHRTNSEPVKADGPRLAASALRLTPRVAYTASSSASTVSGVAPYRAPALMNARARSPPHSVVGTPRAAPRLAAAKAPSSVIGTPRSPDRPAASSAPRIRASGPSPAIVVSRPVRKDAAVALASSSVPQASARNKSIVMDFTLSWNSVTETSARCLLDAAAAVPMLSKAYVKEQSVPKVKREVPINILDKAGRAVPDAGAFHSQLLVLRHKDHYTVETFEIAVLDDRVDAILPADWIEQHELIGLHSGRLYFGSAFCMQNCTLKRLQKDSADAAAAAAKSSSTSIAAPPPTKSPVQSTRPLIPAKARVASGTRPSTHLSTGRTSKTSSGASAPVTPAVKRAPSFDKVAASTRSVSVQKRVPPAGKPPTSPPTPKPTATGPARKSPPLRATPSASKLAVKKSVPPTSINRPSAVPRSPKVAKVEPKKPVQDKAKVSHPIIPKVSVQRALTQFGGYASDGSSEFDEHPRDTDSGSQSSDHEDSTDEVPAHAENVEANIQA